MNRLFYVLIIICTLYSNVHAGKVTSYPENTEPEDTDILYIVDDPAGTPASNKITVGNLLADKADVTNAETITDLPALTNGEYEGKVWTTVNAGTTIAQYKGVYIDPTTGEYLITDRSDVTVPYCTKRAFGMALEAGTDGNPLLVLKEGTIRNDSWTWNPGVPLYFDASGDLTETAPSTTNECHQPVAHTVTAVSIEFYANNITGYGVVK